MTAFLKIRRLRFAPLCAEILLGIAVVRCALPAATDRSRDSSPAEASSLAAAPRSPFPEVYQIELRGRKDRWQARYPGADGVLATGDDVLITTNLHLPLDTEVVLLLRSDDFVYTLAIPEWKLKEIAVPQLEFQMRFTPAESGEFEIQGDQLCGDPHSELRGLLVVESRERFLDWLAQHPSLSSGGNTL